MPPISTISGSLRVMRSRAPRAAPRSGTASRRPSCGSPRRARGAPPRRAALGSSNSAIRPWIAGRLLAPSVLHAVFVDLAPPAAASASRRSRSSAGSGGRAGTAGQEQADRADEGRPVPDRRAEHAPRRRQEVAVQADVTMMTKRSSHMPMLTRIDDDEQHRHAASGRCLNQNSCGMTTLQQIIAQYDQRVRTESRGSMNMNRSYALPLYQAMKSFDRRSRSRRSSPVASMTLAMFSRCRIGDEVLEAVDARGSGSASVSTIAKPEKMAPATKYGGKIVVCQPGMMRDGEVEATRRCAPRDQRRRQAGEQQVRRLVALPVPRRAAPAEREHAVDDRGRRGSCARSRSVARSGIRPTYQNSSETVT